MKSLQERLWSRVPDRPEQGCWLYTGSVNSNGYPQIWTGGRPVLCHRLTLAWATGNIGIGLDASHSDGCVSRRCIRPDHLSWKTHQENLWDVVKKHGRLGKHIKTARKPLPLLDI